MQVKKVKVEFDVTGMEEAIEKANQLKSLLQEVKQLIDSLTQG